jgi:hypothetical protein
MDLLSIYEREMARSISHGFGPRLAVAAEQDATDESEATTLHAEVELRFRFEEVDADGVDVGRRRHGGERDD